VGDPTSHGAPLSPGPGSANVLIGGKPAWRATADFHSCPLVDAAVGAHVGGVVLVGSVTVLINNLPAARQGDIIGEPIPDSIVVGCPTVLIG
jgi:uncharacterized Zn-binding protein involved in type VI secretion